MRKTVKRGSMIGNQKFGPLKTASLYVDGPSQVSSPIQRFINRNA
jgi:hypothetical protein